MIGAALGVGAAVGAVAHAGPALAAVLPGVGGPLGIRSRLGGDDRAALTFDDGPHPQGTPKTLELLREAGAQATFFLVGEQVERRPALAAEIAAAGHQVGLHCHLHRNQLRLRPAAIRADAERARALIEEATGSPVRLHRPPYGIYSACGLWITRSRGWEPVLWSRRGRDWARTATPQSIARDAASGAVGGDIILLHDADYYSVPGSWTRTVAALPSILEELERSGLRLATVASVEGRPSARPGTLLAE